MGTDDKKRAGPNTVYTGCHQAWSRASRANEFSAWKSPRVYFLPSGKCLPFHWDL